MTGDVASLTLVDEQDLADLGTFLTRAARLDATAVRLQASGRVLAVTVCTRAGHGLMGEGTVLGLRAFALAEDATCDAAVAIDAVQDRIARLRSTSPTGLQPLAIPPVPVIEAWTGLSAPRTGWEPAGMIAGDVVARVASEGIAQVSSARSAAARDEVWQRTVPGTSLPSAAALAVHALGFTAPELTVFVQGRWHRVSSAAGHVLTR